MVASYDYGEIDASGNLDAGKNNGNVARQTTNFAGLSQAFVQTFQYDSLSRLTEAKEMSGTTQTFRQNFGYDRYGNRTSFSQLLGTQQTNQNPTVDPATNRFTTGQGFVYDFNGNLTTDNQGRQFTFNGDNKQVEVRDSATNTVGLYYYDGSGSRVKKISASETTIFVYDAGGKLVAEYSTQTAAVATISYLTNDTLGSPRVVTDNSGAVISRRDFMPFGEELYVGTTNRTVSNKYSTTGSDNVRKRFTSYEKDTETGLDFAEARYYDNRYGRFTAVDPLLASGKSADPQTFNRYVYVANNPISLTDPTGMFIEAWTYYGALSGIGTNNGLASPFMEIPEALPDVEQTTQDKIERGVQNSLFENALEAAGLSSNPVDSAEAIDGEVTSSTTENSVQSTVFRRLWNAHPSIAFRGPNGENLGHNPINEKNPDGSLKYKNQCAIRLSWAIMGAGYLKEFQDTYLGFTTGQRIKRTGTTTGYAIQAKQLSEWLPLLFGPGVEIRGSDKVGQLLRMRGIVYVEHFKGTDPGTWNHIDLWDIYHFADGSSAWIQSAKKVMFWKMEEVRSR